MARRLSLGWLKPPKATPDGVMSLADHLRELRYRLIVAAIAIVIAAIVAFFFYEQIYNFLLEPYLQGKAAIEEHNHQQQVEAVLSGITSALMLNIMVCAVAGLVVSSPVWLYQIWAYLAPALLAKEKKYALSFLGASVPLFLAGVAIGYLIMPQAIAVMLGFTPNSVANLIYVDDFFKLMFQLMIVFGLGFVMPVIVVALNMIGVLPSKALAASRSYVLFGCAVFGAAATPGGDPFSMLALAIPMMVLFVVAELICRANDKRRAKRLGTDLVTT